MLQVSGMQVALAAIFTVAASANQEPGPPMALRGTEPGRAPRGPGVAAGVRRVWRPGPGLPGDVNGAEPGTWRGPSDICTALLLRMVSIVFTKS